MTMVLSMYSTYKAWQRLRAAEAQEQAQDR